MIFPHNKLVIATHNAGKLREFARLLPLPQLTLVAAGELGLPEPEETGASFAANAELKANAACAASGLAALADDSGLCVDALDGAPGIHSARWAGESKNFAAAIGKVETLLAAKGLTPTGQRAAFVAVLHLAFPDGSSLTAQGRVSGILRFPPTGTGGFGYDPVFVPDGETRCFAEMTAEEKNRFSHRAMACAALLKRLGRRSV